MSKDPTNSFLMINNDIAKIGVTDEKSPILEWTKNRTKIGQMFV